MVPVEKQLREVGLFTWAVYDNPYRCIHVFYLTVFAFFSKLVH